MIRGQHNVCVAVRRPDGTVAVRQQPLSPLFTGAARRVPLVRGVIALTETLTLGMKALNFSANVGMEAEGEELSGVAMAMMMTVSLAFAIGVFFLAPLFASEWLEGHTRLRARGQPGRGRHSPRLLPRLHHPHRPHERHPPRLHVPRRRAHDRARPGARRPA